jgi:hypothetical protein
MKTFKDFVSEMNIAGAGGVFGDASSMGHGGAVGNSDFYAPGDARIPKIMGIFRRPGMAKRKKKRKLRRAIKRKSKR